MIIDKRLFEIHAKFIFDPWIRIRAFFTGVKVSSFTEFPGHELADLRKVTRLFFNGYFPFAVLPPLEGVHLTLRGRIPHPLNDLPCGNYVNIRSAHHFIQELPEGPPVPFVVKPGGVEIKA